MGRWQWDAGGRPKGAVLRGIAKRAFRLGVFSRCLAANELFSEILPIV